MSDMIATLNGIRALGVSGKVAHTRPESNKLRQSMRRGTRAGSRGRKRRRPSNGANSSHGSEKAHGVPSYDRVCASPAMSHVPRR